MRNKQILITYYAECKFDVINIIIGFGTLLINGFCFIFPPLPINASHNAHLKKNIK